MTVADIGGIASLVGLVVIPVTVVFSSGRKAQKLEDHETRIGGLEITSVSHADKINNHAVEIGKLNAWRDGYHAGAKAISREEG